MIKETCVDLHSRRYRSPHVERVHGAALGAEGHSISSAVHHRTARPPSFRAVRVLSSMEVLGPNIQSLEKVHTREEEIEEGQEEVESAGKGGSED